jgi:hypothetical protein
MSHNALLEYRAQWLNASLAVDRKCFIYVSIYSSKVWDITIFRPELL